MNKVNPSSSPIYLLQFKEFKSAVHIWIINKIKASSQSVLYWIPTRDDLASLYLIPDGVLVRCYVIHAINNDIDIDIDIDMELQQLQLLSICIFSIAHLSVFNAKIIPAPRVVTIYTQGVTRQ